MKKETIRIEGITDEAHNALIEVSSDVYHLNETHETWCYSDSCAHNSHSRGQDRDRYDIPLPACKANYFISPFLKLTPEISEEDSINGYYDPETETFYHTVLRFCDGRVLERVQEKHWAAKTVLVAAGHPTNAQMAKMSAPSVGPWNE